MSQQILNHEDDSRTQQPQSRKSGRKTSITKETDSTKQTESQKK